MAKETTENGCDLPKPSLEQIKKVLQKSGYLLEQRICPIVERYGFFTTPNEQYQDQDTGKSREIDIEAIQPYFLYRKELTDIFWTYILLECKNNSTPAVFFTQKNPVPERISGYVSVSGYPDGIYDEKYGGVVSIEDYFHFARFHHNYKVKWIARQFCQLTAKTVAKGTRNQTIEWGVSHEGLHESVEGLAKATSYHSSKLKSDVVLKEESKDAIELGIVYPILLFAGQIFECRITGKTFALSETKHVTFHRTIESKTLKGTFHIDVIQEDYLPRFLKIVNEESEKIVRRFKEKRDLLKTNVRRNFAERKKSQRTFTFKGPDSSKT